MVLPPHAFGILGESGDIFVHDVDWVVRAIVNQGFDGTRINVVEGFVIFGQQL